MRVGRYLKLRPEKHVLACLRHATLFLEVQTLQAMLF